MAGIFQSLQHHHQPHQQLALLSPYGEFSFFLYICFFLSFFFFNSNRLAQRGQPLSIPRVVRYQAYQAYNSSHWVHLEPELRSIEYLKSRAQSPSLVDLARLDSQAYFGTTTPRGKAMRGRAARDGQRGATRVVEEGGVFFWFFAFLY